MAWKHTVHRTLAALAAGTMVVTLIPGTALARDDDDRPDSINNNDNNNNNDADKDDDGELVLLTEVGPTVDDGDSVWVALKWTAEDGPVRNVRVTAGGRDLEIAYPENTGDYSAPFNGPNLLKGEVDYTAFRLEVPEGVDAFRLTIRATWETGGRTQSDKWSLKLPVQQYDGEDLVLESTEIELVEGAGWVELRFTGQAPSLRRFQVMVPNPDKAYLEYPQGDFASLERDNRLTRGETDVARFYMDASHLGSGEFKLEISAIYRKGGKSVTTPFTVVIRIP